MLHPPPQTAKVLRHGNTELLGPAEHDEQIAIRNAERISEEIASLQFHTDLPEPFLELETRRGLLFLVATMPHGLEPRMKLGGDEGERFELSRAAERTLDAESRILP